ncbi:MAG: HU family DNA-binding protein [Paludibacteraceae bacterium]
MSKEKLSIPEVIDLMTREGNFTKKDAEEFIKVFLSTVEDALLLGENVKVKGLGTFKSQWYEARQSIDVNTGNEIIIPGYYRVIFAPELEIKHSINEPFAHLETISLPDEKNNEEHTPDKSPLTGEGAIEKKDVNLIVLASQVEEIKGILSDINALSGKVAKTEENEQKVTEPARENFEKIDENDALSLEITEKQEVIAQDVASGKATDKETETELQSTVEKKVATECEILEAEAEFDIVRGVSIIYHQEDVTSQDGTNDGNQDSLQTVDHEDSNEVSIVQSNETEIIETTRISELEKSVEEDEDDEFDEENYEDELTVDETPYSETEIPKRDDSEITHVSLEDSNRGGVSEEEISQQQLNALTSAEQATLDEKPVVSLPDTDTDTEADKDTQEIKVPDTEEDTAKRKIPLTLIIVASVVLIGGIVAWLLPPFISKINEEKQNQLRLEYLADSLANVARVRQIKELINQKAGVIDSTETSDTLFNDTRKNQTEVLPANQKTTNKPEVEPVTDIYSSPRTYNESMAEEKMISGSQLTKFARKYYGSPHFWVYIYEANKDKIKDPNNVPTGIEIKIPKMNARLVDPKNKESVNFAIKLQKEYVE